MKVTVIFKLNVAGKLFVPNTFSLESQSINTSVANESPSINVSVLYLKIEVGSRN